MFLRHLRRNAGNSRIERATMEGKLGISAFTIWLNATLSEHGIPESRSGNTPSMSNLQISPEISTGDRDDAYKQNEGGRVAAANYAYAEADGSCLSIAGN